MNNTKTRFVAAAFLCTFLFAAISATQGALLSNIIDFFSLTSDRQGYAASAQNAGCIAALGLALCLTRKIPLSRLMGLAAAGMTVCLLPLGLVSYFSSYIAVIAVMGIAMGCADMSTSAAISNCYSGAAASRMMCALHGTFGIAGVAFPPVYAYLAGKLPRWNYVYLVIFALAAILTAYILPACESRARSIHKTAEAGEPFRFALLPEFLKDGRCAAVLATVLLFSVFFGGVSVWCERYVNVTLAGAFPALTLPLLWLAMTGSRMGSALVVKRPARYLLIAPILSGVALAAGVLAQSATLAMAGIFLSILAGGAVVPIALGVVGDIFRKNTQVSTTMTLFVVYLGQMLGSPLVGAVESAAGLDTGLLVLSGICVFSAFPALALRKKQ